MKTFNKYFLLPVISVVLFYLVPVIGTNIISADAGMVFMILLLFIVNPIFFIIFGIKSESRSIYMPAICTGIYIISYGFVLGMWEMMYPLVYTVLSYISFLIEVLKNEKHKHRKKR